MTYRCGFPLSLGETGDERGLMHWVAFPVSRHFLELVCIGLILISFLERVYFLSAIGTIRSCNLQLERWEVNFRRRAASKVHNS